MIAWTERGGILADCGARGGGEYGEDWHLAGKGPTKPNTWRDFIACAEYLIDKKYTSPAHLAGEGASAGGILIGRAITERPDLFGAALIGSGVLDALRSETTANGVGNIQEFGSTKTEEGFKALYAMSAYHHVQDRTPYPAVLLTVGHQRSARGSVGIGQDDGAFASRNIERKARAASRGLCGRPWW